MDTSLARIFTRETVLLTIDHARYFMYQLLCGLNYLSSAGIVHQAINPDNIHINSNCELKVTNLKLVHEFRDDDPVANHFYGQYKSLDDVC